MSTANVVHKLKILSSLLEMDGIENYTKVDEYSYYFIVDLMLDSKAELGVAFPKNQEPD